LIHPWWKWRLLLLLLISHLIMLLLTGKFV